MDGIKYVTDEQNRRVAVQIDLDKYGELWEEFYDAIIAESRQDEESEPFDQAVSELNAEGKYDGPSGKD